MLWTQRTCIVCDTFLLAPNIIAQSNEWVIETGASWMKFIFYDYGGEWERDYKRLVTTQHTYCLCIFINTKLTGILIIPVPQRQPMLYIYEAQCLLSNANNNQIVRRVHFSVQLLALSFFSTSTLSDALTWNNLTFLMKSIASATRHKNYCNYSGKKIDYLIHVNIEWWHSGVKGVVFFSSLKYIEYKHAWLQRAHEFHHSNNFHGSNINVNEKSTLKLHFAWKYL